MCVINYGQNLEEIINILRVWTKNPTSFHWVRFQLLKHLQSQNLLACLLRFQTHQNKSCMNWRYYFAFSSCGMVK